MFWLQINLFSWNNYDTLYTWSLKRVDCDLQEMKHFSPCNCASCDLWEKLYSREKNAYKTDQKVIFFVELPAVDEGNRNRRFLFII